MLDFSRNYGNFLENSKIINKILFFYLKSKFFQKIQYWTARKNSGILQKKYKWFTKINYLLGREEVHARCSRNV